MAPYQVLGLHVPEGEQRGELGRHERVVDGLLEPGGALLHVQRVEDEHPPDDQVVHELGGGTGNVVDAPAEVRALEEMGIKNT